MKNTSSLLVQPEYLQLTSRTETRYILILLNWKYNYKDGQISPPAVFPCESMSMRWTSLISVISCMLSISLNFQYLGKGMWWGEFWVSHYFRLWWGVLAQFWLSCSEWSPDQWWHSGGHSQIYYKRNIFWYENLDDNIYVSVPQQY